MIPHGTWNGYNNYACRCEPCTSAARRYRKRLAVERLSGREPVVDATPAREHLLRAQMAGVSIRVMSERTGLHRSTLQEIRRGRRPRVGRAIAQRVLASDITADMSSQVEVPATGSTRRLRALATLGWGSKSIAAHCEASEEAIDEIRRGVQSVHALTHQRVATTYRRLILMTPPSRTPQERAAATLTRRLAERNGWAGPFDWDDIDTDEAPAPSEPYKPATVPQQARDLQDMGLNDEQIGLRLRIKPSTVREYLTRRAAA